MIRLARSTLPAVGVAEAHRALTAARGSTAARLPTPILAFSRESVDYGRPTGSQDIVTVALPIDWVRPQFAAAQQQAEGLLELVELVGREQQAVLQAVLIYHDAVLGAQESLLAEGALRVLEQVSGVLTRRLEAGTASGYEVQRLAIERELRHAALVRAQAAAQAARAALGVWLNGEVAASRLPSTLAPLPEADAEALLRREVTAHPVGQGLEAATAQALVAEKRASLTWLPTLELVGGVKHVSDLGGGYGYVLGLALDVPLFDQGQTLRAEAQAVRALAEAESEQFRRRSLASLQRLRTEYKAQRRELQRFEAVAPASAQALLQAAQSAYQEGEQSIVALVDAQRAHTEVAVRRLQLLRDVKRLEVELRAVTGELR